MYQTLVSEMIDALVVLVLYISYVLRKNKLLFTLNFFILSINPYINHTKR